MAWCPDECYRAAAAAAYPGHGAAWMRKLLVASKSMGIEMHIPCTLHLIGSTIIVLYFGSAAISQQSYMLEQCGMGCRSCYVCPGINLMCILAAGDVPK